MDAGDTALPGAIEDSYEEIQLSSHSQPRSPVERRQYMAETSNTVNPVSPPAAVKGPSESILRSSLKTSSSSLSEKPVSPMVRYPSWMDAYRQSMIKQDESAASLSKAVVLQKQHSSNASLSKNAILKNQRTSNASLSKNHILPNQRASNASLSKNAAPKNQRTSNTSLSKGRAPSSRIILQQQSSRSTLRQQQKASDGSMNHSIILGTIRSNHTSQIHALDTAALAKSFARRRMSLQVDELPSRKRLPPLHLPNREVLTYSTSATPTVEIPGSPIDLLPPIPKNSESRQISVTTGSRSRPSISVHVPILTTETVLAEETLRKIEAEANIVFQLTVHYLGFILMFISAGFSWAPKIDFSALPLYIIISFIHLQFSRVCFSLDAQSMIPLYTSFAPFAILMGISREAHMIVVALWYISLSVVFLQSGNKNLIRHVSLYSFLFPMCYLFVIYIMSIYFVCDPKNLANDCVLSRSPLNPPIDWYQECIFIFGTVMVVATSVRLVRFIKLNALTVVERDNFLTQLNHANTQLRRELRRYGRRQELDLGAPIARVMTTLRDLKKRDHIFTDTSMLDAINLAIDLLTSNQLFKPSLETKAVDSDVQDWLRTVMQTHEIKPADKPLNQPKITALNPEGEEISRDETHGKKVAITILQLLDQMNSWSFNVFDIDLASHNRPLFYIGVEAIRQHDLFRKLNLNKTLVKNWLRKIESLYIPTNPYHNSIHAADVTAILHHFLTRPSLSGKFTAEETLASLIAAMAHDVQHPGFNNAFLIHTRHPIAVRYNDKAVLENLHASIAFDTLLSDASATNFLSHLPSETYKLIRELAITLILATDMAMHFEWIGRFKSKLLGNGIEYTQYADRKLVLVTAMKASDVNNSAKPNHLSQIWTEKILEEFFRQGDEEKNLGMVVSTFMNRDATDIPKSQLGFIDFIVLPLYEPWTSFINELQIMENIQNNKNYWRKKSEKEALSGMPPSPVVTRSRAMLRHD